jgi:AraC-like DNA-binding protein
MEVAGRGRILFWEGVSLWIMEAVPSRGTAYNSTDHHAHHAIQITLSLGGRFELRSGEHTLACDGMVAPDAVHIFEAAGLGALLFIDPESQAGRAIAGSAFGIMPLVPIQREMIADLVEQLRTVYVETAADEEALEHIGRQLVARLAGVSSAEPPDPRVQKIIDFVTARLDGPITLAAASRSAGLSPSRARHLFVEQTGLPFRTYLLWRRIMKAVGVFAGGGSLTDAAHEAGFADSAHFSRTFRRMFGLPAASLRII